MSRKPPSRFPDCRAQTHCRRTCGSSTTSCSATDRCSPDPTGWPPCGRSPTRCSATGLSRSPTHPARGVPRQRPSWPHPTAGYSVSDTSNRKKRAPGVNRRCDPTSSSGTRSRSRSSRRVELPRGISCHRVMALTIVTAMGYPSDMTYRRLGDSGLVVSAVGLGTNNFGMKLGMEECREVVDAAIDNGITLFDTSDSYGPAEERLGALLEGRRDDVIIATKFGSDVRRRGLSNGVDWGARGSRRYVRRAVESSLTRLRTDWIDLYQMHKPDPGTPIEETLSALSDLVHEGKVRYLGNSNFAAWQITEAEWTARTSGRDRFISAQNEYNLLKRDAERELVPALVRYGLGLLPFYPLANGLLTGKYHRGEPPPAGSRI